MVNTVILYCSADADRAGELASAWPSRRVILCKVDPTKARMSFGKHIALFGLWSPASGDAGMEVSALITTVREHKRRAVLLVCATTEPPLAAVENEVTIIFTSHATADVARLDRLAP